MFKAFSQNAIKWGLHPITKIGALIVSLVLLFVATYSAHYLYGERTDLLICLNAAKRLLAGQNVYLASDLWAHTKPPFATLLFVPLAFVDAVWVQHLWDLLNVALLGLAAFIFAKQMRDDCGWDLFYLSLLSCFLILNFWGYELRFGQYNVLTMVMIWWGGTTRRFKSMGTLAFWAAFFIKPSNLLFLPWILKNRDFRLKSFLLESLTVGVVFSLVYGLSFGFKELFEHQMDWLKFMKVANDRYLMREVNFGLPLFFGYLTKQYWPHHLLLLGGLVWGYLWARKEASSFKVFGIVSVLSVMVSPMVWWATFVFFMPLSLWIFVTSIERLRDRQYGRGFAGLFVVLVSTQLIFPNPLMTFVHRLSNPNIFYLLYLAWDFHFHTLSASQKYQPKRAQT